MQTRILLGRAGSTLPALITEVAAARTLGRPVLVLVPEQFTLLTEQELMSGLSLPGLLDIDVLSPSRLRQKVFERGGRDPRTPLDDRGRRMALSRVLTGLQKSLTYYARSAKAQGLPEKLAVLLADMKRAGMTAQELRDHADSLPNGATKAKETDLALIWEAYEELLADQFADDELIQAEVSRRLPLSGICEGAAVFVTGFDVLPRPFCAQLAHIAGLAASLTVLLTCDGEQAPDGRIFTAQRMTAEQLMDALHAAGQTWEVVSLPHTPVSPDGALQHLESSLFAVRGSVWVGEAEAIRIHAAANPFAETQDAAALLLAEHERGVAWDDMAVAMADAAKYQGIVPMTFDGCGIPYYLAEKLPALRHGLVRMLPAALRAATGGWKQEDVLAYLKSGFASVSGEDAWRLENYALQNGINGRRWAMPFTRGEDAADFEPLRMALMAPLLRLNEGLRSARTADASLTAVFGLLTDVGAYERLLAREEELLSRGMQTEAAQNRQVWKLILNTLDQYHELLSGARAPMADMARWLASGFEDAQISALPASPSTVMVGEAGHMALNRVRVLLVLGMSETGASAQNSLITERERAALTEAHHGRIGLTAVEEQALRKSDFYRTLTLPTERLILTHAQSTQDGEGLRASNLLADVKRIFPAVTETGGVQDALGSARPLAPLSALSELALRLRRVAEGEDANTAMPTPWREAFAWLWQNEPYAATLRQTLAGLTESGDTPPLDAGRARALFGRDTVSISRLETFAACPYKHFVQYGLQPVERREFTFENDDKGSFFHDAMSAYAKRAGEIADWPANMDEERVDALMDEIVAPLEKAWEDGPLGEDARSRALGQSYAETVKRAAWMFTRQAQNSRFRTLATELAFGEEGGLPPLVLTLSDGSRVALRGRIDRLDGWDSGHGEYLRVIDYKSSEHALEPTKLWYGLQLQLMLYLQAAEAGVPQGKSAGAFYFTMADPDVTVPEDVKEKAEAEIAKKLRLKGVVLADAEVVAAMDAGESGFSLPKVFKADGTVSPNAMAVDATEMAALLDHAQAMACELTERMRGGQIAPAPAKTDKWDACRYCDYALLCGRDLAKTSKKRELPCLKKEDFRTELANKSDISLSASAQTGGSLGEKD